MYRIYFLTLIILISITNWNCSNNSNYEGTSFTKLSATETGIDFENFLAYNRDFNIYQYRNFYNGGGVAVGDINNDGWMDLYFTSNMDKNQLYLNKGDQSDGTTGFQFENITTKAGVGGTKAWSTGVAMADVNADGFIDIYVCNSGDIAGDNKQNELFINQGDGTFKEEAEAYGLADQGFSTHAVFFDYDKDGDLDMYLLNNSYQAIGSFNLKKNERPIRDEVGGDKLFRNDDGKFIDVSEEAGIYGSVIGFGLGVTVGDINLDGWQDIFISNDFFERDYLYINNGDGTFREELEQCMRAISGASMGADMADINNDGYMDLFVTDMLPDQFTRLKTKTTFENWDRYQYGIQNDYWHQFTRNVLHLNNQDDTFSEIGRLAGVEATDWSWGALIFDMDNDGWRDIFVANGIAHDLTDQDYINFASSDEVKKAVISKDNKVDFKKLIDIIPSTPLPNYAFVNQKDLTFSNEADAMGLTEATFSNGSVYADLDNDGDLDLVLNNVNMPASIYRNEAQNLTDNHYLQFKFEGKGKNKAAIGTKITIHHQGNIFYTEQMPMRGFQSSVDPRLHIGLGNLKTVDSLIVTWPDSTIYVQTNVPTNQVIELNQNELSSTVSLAQKKEVSPFFKAVQNDSLSKIQHLENRYVDFDRDRLIFHMASTEGARLAVGDVNQDGSEDIYLGGAIGQAGQLLIQQENGGFQATNQSLFARDAESEDIDAIFFDANGDQALDLYVTSGGSEYANNLPQLSDRLYLNDGTGKFKRSPQVFPAINFVSSSGVDAADFDGDGDLDLLVGGRLRSGKFGVPAKAYILENDGTGKFREVSRQIAPDLQNIGMITDVRWTDFDGDDDQDMMIIGHWMGITFFENVDNQFKNVSDQVGLAKTNGWWNTITPTDIDGDGDMDYLIGNQGLNHRFEVEDNQPILMHINDYDKNGTIEQILCSYSDDISRPLILRHDLVMQLPHLKKKYLKYENFKDQTFEDIFEQEERKGTLTLQINKTTSVLLRNENGQFKLEDLPTVAQLSSVYAFHVEDVNQDGIQDILLGGNLYEVKPEIGRYDAAWGTLLLGQEDGTFKAVSQKLSGFKVDGQVRDIKTIKIQGEAYLLVARNNDSLVLFQSAK